MATTTAINTLAEVKPTLILCEFCITKAEEPRLAQPVIISLGYTIPTVSTVGFTDGHRWQCDLCRSTHGEVRHVAGSVSKAAAKRIANAINAEATAAWIAHDENPTPEAYADASDLGNKANRLNKFQEVTA